VFTLVIGLGYGGVSGLLPVIELFGLQGLGAALRAMLTSVGIVSLWSRGWWISAAAVTNGVSHSRFCPGMAGFAVLILVRLCAAAVRAAVATD
jgi:hypothetical protein